MAGSLVLHHHLKEFDDDLAAWPDEYLALAAAFCVSDALESVVKDVDAHHDITTAVLRVRHRE